MKEHKTEIIRGYCPYLQQEHYITATYQRVITGAKVVKSDCRYSLECEQEAECPLLEYRKAKFYLVDSLLSENLLGLSQRSRSTPVCFSKTSRIRSHCAKLLFLQSPENLQNEQP